MIVKKGLNSTYHFAVTNIVSTNKEANAVIALYNYQQQKIGEVKTNTDGFAKLDVGKNVAFAIVSKNNNKNYIK